jgi:hypothetical protein
VEVSASGPALASEPAVAAPGLTRCRCNKLHERTVRRDDAREGVGSTYKQPGRCRTAVEATRSRCGGSSDVRSTAWEDDAHHGVLRGLHVNTADARVSNYSSDWYNTRFKAMAGAPNQYG